MKEITIFHLDTCPYCIKARRALAELKKEVPAYAAVEERWIEEQRQPKLTEGYDYWYVPTIFFGKQKLYEAAPGQDYETIKGFVRNALDAVINA